MLLLRLLLSRENSSDGLDLIRGDRVGELYFESDEQVACLVGGFVERHTEVFAGHHLVWFDSLAFLALNSDQSSIEVHDREVHSS